jgi:hypothetical protein
MSPSEVTRQVIHKLLARTPEAMTAIDVPTVDVRRKKRIEVRILLSEWAMVESTATTEGFSPNVWIAAIVRARLGKEPQLGQYELEQLAASNTRLLAIGRNVNQIARALNANPTEDSAYRAEIIEELSEAIKFHTSAVSAVIQSNVQRWSR